MTKFVHSENDLRQQVRLRLADGRLRPTTVASYKIHRGTGRPCVVCVRVIASNQDQWEVPTIGGVLIAHKACYVLWREESRRRHDENR